MRLEAPGGLLAHLAHHGLEQRLAVLDVAGGLVEDQAAVDALLDDQEAAVGLGDGRDGDFGLCGHASELYSAGRGRRRA